MTEEIVKEERKPQLVRLVVEGPNIPEIPESISTAFEQMKQRGGRVELQVRRIKHGPLHHGNSAIVATDNSLQPESHSKG